jgi:hypothetical protein
MTERMSIVAGFEAAAGAARPHAGHGFCAYPWQIGTSRAGHTVTRNVMITDSKLHIRWPQEPSP